MNSTAFITATPLLARIAPAPSNSTFTARRQVSTVSTSRRSVIVTMKDPATPDIPKIPQGFTLSSEQLNGRAAMIGFILGVVTEALTGKGIIGQVSSIFEVINKASALSK